MTFKAVFILIGLVTLAAAHVPQLFYHKNVGIPLANSIRQTEEAQNIEGSRIVGGSPAPAGAHPYLIGTIIALQSGFTSVCGSCMLTNTKAVTSAHCWYDGWRDPALKFTLVFGSTTLFFGGIRIDTSDVEMHPNWNTQTLENDIAVVTFDWVPYTNVIQPINLPTGSLLTNDFTGYWAQASGFGRTGDGPGGMLNTQQVQSHVTIQVISNAECRQTFNNYVFDSTICTSGREGRGICGSDSGGPLSIRHNNQNVLIGVVSYYSGFGCESRRPNGYARVTSFVPWIVERL